MTVTFKLFLSILLLSVSTWAQQDLELKLKGSTQAESNQEARGKIQAQLIEQAVQTAIQQLIGEKKANDSKNQLKQVYRQSNKFVPYFKAGELVQTPSGYEMEATLRLSLKDLRQVLLKSGLLYEKEGSWIVLPLVKVVDRINTQQFVWWTQTQNSPTLAQKSAARFESALRDKFLAQGFLVLRPVQSEISLMLPAQVMQPNLAWDQQQKLAQRLASDLILTGEIEILSSTQPKPAANISIRVTGTHRVTARVVGEVVRNFTVDNLNQALTKESNFFDEAAMDLATQVFETWKRGTLGAELVQIHVKGTLSPQDLNDFKSWVQEKATAVKTLKERRFEVGAVTFEADVTSSLNEIVGFLNTSPSDKFSIRIGSVNEKELDLYWSAKK